MAPSDRHPVVPPPGPWVMVQRWHDLLFAHWRCSMSALRPLVPASLEIEAFDGTPWIGLIPFYMTGVRMRAMPPVPSTHRFEELNVRTYVTLDGRPGVWFFSLDAASTLAVIGARLGIGLPYFRASMEMTSREGVIRYTSRRWPIAGPSASFAASYQGTGPAAPAAPGTLEHFLAERYALYAGTGKRLWRGDIFHPRWEIQAASARIDHNSMIAAAGVPAADDAPLLHFSRFQDVRLWWPVRVR